MAELLKAFMIKSVFYIFDQGFVLINCILLMRIFLNIRPRKSKLIITALLLLIVSGLIASMLSGNDSLEKIREIIIFLLPFAEVLIVFKKPPILKSFAVIFAYGIIGDSIIWLTSKYLIDNEKIKEPVEIGFDLFFLIIITILYITIYNKWNPSEKFSYLDALTFILVCGMIISFILTVVMLNVNYRDSKFSWIIIIDILMFSSLIPYIISSMLKAKQSEAYFRRALDTETRHFEIISEKDEDLRRFRHDYANHMRCISAMIEDGQANEVKKYVEKLGVDLQNTSRDFYTGNYMLDIIMSEKNSVATQDGNAINFEGRFPKSGIRNDDICTIMANALDNAIEACKNIEMKCEIKVKSIIKDNQVAVSITNPVQNKTYIIGNSVATTKLDKTRHGFGLKSIKKAVAKYDGITRLSSDNKIFELSFNLKYK